MTSFALSERGAGSDAAGIETTATREGEGWWLRGEKYWIGNGGVSQSYVVFAKTDPAAGVRGISAFMVEKGSPGVVIDDFADKMGLRGTTTSNLKLDTHVPDSARIGEEGRALRLAFATLDIGRITVAAQSVGVALAAYREAARDAVGRVAFGQPIIENQGVAFKLADMATEISAARIMLYESAKAYDDGRDITTLSAMAKLHASEVAHRAADHAVQIWAAAAIAGPPLSSGSIAIKEFWKSTKAPQRSNAS